MSSGYEIIIENGRRIVRGLGHYETFPVEDCRELIKSSVKNYSSKIAFRFKRDGKLIEKTYIDLDKDIDSLGTALHNIGLTGCYISIYSENRYEWGVAYYSIINGTGIGVPLDKYLPCNEVENLVQRGGVEAIFYSAAYHDTMIELSKNDLKLKLYICMDEIPLPKDDMRFVSMQSLIQKGNELLEKGDKRFVDAAINREAMSVLLFTSGTTKASKGVMLSHKNIASNVTAVTALLEVYPTDVHLSLLPLHHTFENTIGLMFMILKGITISYSEGIKYLAQNIKEFKVSILVGVPAIFEAIYNKLMDGIDKSGKKNLINTITKVSSFLQKLSIDVRRKLFKAVLEKLGPDLRLFVSGAAPINAEILKGFQRFGITFLQGYGLTETSPVISATTYFVNVPGTIGIPIKDVEVTIDNPDENGMGEVMARGRNVMLGYFENPEETESVMEKDGWFRTGDLGIINEKGLLRITGRAKSMIVFTNGKKAFPEEYEVLLNVIPGIKESYVWGNTAQDGDIQVCAKIVIDNAYFEHKNYTIEEIGNELEAAIKNLNKGIPQYKIIRYFVMSYNEITKTTKLSIKRPVENQKIKQYLDSVGVDIRKLNKKLIDP